MNLMRSIQNKGTINVNAIGLALVLALLAGACTRDYIPKPLGYNRLELPEAEYISLPDSLPYDFEYSKYARLLQDTSKISERFWIEIYYPTLKSNIHITYKQLNNNKQVLKEY